MNNKHYLLLLILSFMTITACSGQKSDETMTNRVNAPEINTKHGWVNTDKSFTIDDLKGKIVLLDFWTFGCINCQHVIPDLERLEKEYEKELVVIGVHSAKFSSEKSNDKIKKAILKFGIKHPVVNDADFRVWQEYGVNAWPTVVLIDPAGKVVGNRAGEGFYDVVKLNIDNLIKEFGDKINREPLKFNTAPESTSVLRFPSKMLVDDENNIWFSDSGNNRILKINQEGKILETIGSGEKGFENGDFENATFYEPHGLALQNNVLFIADSKNNSIRAANLATRNVITAAGDGQLHYYFFEDKSDTVVNPNSPWDLLIDGDNMYIANAGNHQILKMNVSLSKTDRFKTYRYAGNGREALIDGSLMSSSFNQPSGFTKIGNILYVADAEASAVRAIDLKKGTVTTPLGKGLFDFGDKDGSTDDALIQHNVGIEAKDGKIYIADTYNGKVKILDLKKEEVTTFLDGFDEPNDILFIADEIWVSDTNNHQLIKVNINTGKREIVTIKE